MKETAGSWPKESSKSPARTKKILWLTRQRPPIWEKLEADPFFQGWEWHQWSTPQPLPADFHPRLVLIQASTDPELDWARQVSQQFPSSIRILLQDLPGLPVLKKAVNRADIFSALPWPAGEGGLKELLREAVIESQLLESHNRLLRESSRQNRELEKLNASLENIVEERTEHIQSSKELEEEKVSRIRNLIRFIQELSGMASLEDVLDLLRRDLRGFHQVADPILLYELDARGPQILFFRQGQMQSRPWPHGLDPVRHIHLQDPEMSRRLANEFSRPFGKALVIPLEVQGNEALPVPSVQLVLENSLPETEVSPVLDFCLERLRPLCTAIERIRVETDLTHYTYRWEKTFDGLRDPIAIIDRSDRVLRANRKFSERSLRGACFESFDARPERCEGCPVPQVLSTGRSAHGQVKRGGRIFEVYSYPISLVAGGPVTNVVNQYVDQTRSREIYMRLLQSEKMGALGLLAGNIAHELNNPLTGLRSLAQVLISEAVPGSQIAQDLGEIERATERCQKIIRNLLDFVQRGETQLQDVSLEELVDKTLPLLKTAFRFLRLDRQMHHPQILIRAEPHLLQQVIFNLIHNACQAMNQHGDGRGTLTLDTEVTESHLRLWIRDTGPGIPAALHQQIFEPFFTTKKEGAGTGLGLSLSREIVESFGGAIGVESEMGKGASFWIEFPIHREGA